jgi:L-aminopeptidase/D-esterase-like protein
MAHDGIARAIDPAHLTRDGDTIFAAAVGEVTASLDLVGAMAADVVAAAIVRGVRAARPARNPGD